MQDSLRTPFFIVAVALMALIFLTEIGSRWMPASSSVSPGEFSAKADAQLSQDPHFKDDGARKKAVDDLTSAFTNRREKPPGNAIPYMALLDGLVLYTVLLMGAALIVPEGIQGRAQGCLSLIVSILVILAGIVMFFAAFTLVLVMVGLFMAVPFGTIAYIAVWGFFDRGGASMLLSLLMLLKLAFSVCLLLAHQRFLQNKGLVLIILTSLIGNILISFLHGFVPLVLVSITDVIAAIILVILAIVWAIFLLIGSVIALPKAIV